MRILGIDEAGRGCVLGPLVVASFLAIDVDPEALRAAGANDSKKLSAAKRDLARERLAALGHAEVRRIEPTAIDEGNLNAVEEAVIADLIREARPDLVRIDALGHPRTLHRIVARLREASGCSEDIPFIMEPGADATFPEVGAASIFAKTTRDRALDAYRAEFAACGDFGSGYPSDPKTRKWLADWHSSDRPWPELVRTRWGTVRDLGPRGIAKLYV